MSRDLKEKFLLGPSFFISEYKPKGEGLPLDFFIDFVLLKNVFGVSVSSCSFVLLLQLCTLKRNFEFIHQPRKTVTGNKNACSRIFYF
jgi:hypothetical protein